MMQSSQLVLLSLLVVFSSATLLRTANQTTETPNGGVLSVFWCGFSGDFCGQSSWDDVNPRATHVILAFANANWDGSINFDQSTRGTVSGLINQWHSSGKKVIFSVGGQNGNWGSVFQGQGNMQNFANSAANILRDMNLDGIDFDLEAYNIHPFDVANLIQMTRRSFDQAFGYRKLIVLSPECVGVYQPSPVTNSSGQAFNYWVPILNQVIDDVDLVQPQAYNNWYGHQGGSFEYLADVYLNWLNEVSLSGQPIPGFRGVPRQKLVLGLLASRQAGGADYFAEAETLGRVAQEIRNRKGQKLGGVMLWDSHWDQANGYAISNKALESIE